MDALADESGTNSRQISRHVAGASSLATPSCLYYCFDVLGSGKWWRRPRWTERIFAYLSGMVPVYNVRLHWQSCRLRWDKPHLRMKAAERQ